MKVIDVKNCSEAKGIVYTVELFNNFPGGDEEGVVLGEHPATVFRHPRTHRLLPIVTTTGPQREDESALDYAVRTLDVHNTKPDNVLGKVYDVELVCSDDDRHVKMTGKITPDRRLDPESIKDLQLRSLFLKAPEKRLLRVICVELPAKGRVLQ